MYWHYTNQSIMLILFRIGLAGAAYGCWGPKGPPSSNLSHISYNDKTWHSCTLLEEDPKNI